MQRGKWFRAFSSDKAKCIIEKGARICCKTKKACFITMALTITPVTLFYVECKNSTFHRPRVPDSPASGYSRDMYYYVSNDLVASDPNFNMIKQTV